MFRKSFSECDLAGAVANQEPAVDSTVAADNPVPPPATDRPTLASQFLIALRDNLKRALTLNTEEDLKSLQKYLKRAPATLTCEISQPQKHIEFAILQKTQVCLLRDNAVPAYELDLFLEESYELIISLDGAVRAYLYRILRYIIQSEDYCAVLTKHLIHLMVIIDFEKRDCDTFIRDEARKLMKVFLDVAPKYFPIEFASSLVAVADAENDAAEIINGKEKYVYGSPEPFRKDALKYLCSLATVNYELVVLVNGFKPMMDAILDPTMSDLSEFILKTILFLLDDPRTRMVVQPCIDMKSILSPFTDFDSCSGLPSQQKRARAKSALITILRTWTGVILFNSEHEYLCSKTSASVEPAGLNQSGGLLRSPADMASPKPNTSPTIEPTYLSHFVGLLSNAGVPKVIQEDVIDCISELFEPLFAAIGAASPGVAGSREHGTIRSFVVKPEMKAKGRSESSPSQSVRKQRAGTDTELFHAEQRPQDDLRSRKKESIWEFFSPSKASEKLPPAQPKIDHRVSQKRPSNPLISPAHLPEIPEDNTPVETDDNEVSEEDPVFNMVDCYSAFLSAAFMHCEIFDVLCGICTSSSHSRISGKSQKLLVNLLKMFSTLLPDAVNSKYMNVSILLEKATSSLSVGLKVGSLESLMASNRATTILESLANAVANTAFHLNESSLSIKSTSVIGLERDVHVSGQGAFRMMKSARGIMGISEDVKKYSVAKQYRSSSEVDFYVEGRSNEGLNEFEYNRLKEKSNMWNPIYLEAKNPLKWDWSAIGEILEFAFLPPFHTINQHSRFNKMMNNSTQVKFVERLCGYYRCQGDSEDKAYFINLNWEPENYRYFEVACALYKLLIQNERYYKFLTKSLDESGNRRAQIFFEISNELKKLIDKSMVSSVKLQKDFRAVFDPKSPVRPQSGGASQAKASETPSKDIFSMRACVQRMTREYFLLIGRLVSEVNESLIHVVDETQIWTHLTNLGHHKNLEYLSRLVFTSLAFSDEGYYSRGMFQTWMAQSTSPDLKKYCCFILYNLLRSRPHIFFKWGLEELNSLITNTIRENKLPDIFVLEILQEAILNERFLRKFIRMKPIALFHLSTYSPIPREAPLASKFTEASQETLHEVQKAVDHILYRFTSIDEGIDFLEKNRNERVTWLTEAISNWESAECENYANQCEKALSSAFCISKSKRSSCNVKPIPVDAKELYSYPHKDVDMEGLLRLPWSIEARLSELSPSANSSISPTAARRDPPRVAGGTVPPRRAGDSNSFEGKDKPSVLKHFVGTEDFAHIDCYLDAADRYPLGDNFPIGSRIVRIRGIVSDVNGMRLTKSYSSDGIECFAGGFKVPTDKKLMATLQIGVCPVHRSGKVNPESLKQVRGGSTLSSAATGTGYANLRSEDLPSSLLFESLQDWIECQPKDRRDHAIDIGGNRFSVSVPGQPVLWVFCKLSEVPSRASVASRDRGVFSAADKHNSARETYVYLSEIHYFLRLDTGNSLFCALPRHLYTDLAKSRKGIEMLHNVVDEKIRHLIQGLNFLKRSYERLRDSSIAAPPVLPPTLPHLSSSTIKRSNSGEFTLKEEVTTERRSTDDTHISTRLLVTQTQHTNESCRADLWALGNIFSSEESIEYIKHAPHGRNKKDFIIKSCIKWLTDTAIFKNSNIATEYLSLRGTMFYFLGVCASTEKGAELVLQKASELHQEWFSSSHANVAVVIPKDFSRLFPKLPCYDIPRPLFPYSDFDEMIQIAGNKGANAALTGQTSAVPSGPVREASDIEAEKENEKEIEILTYITKLYQHYLKFHTSIPGNLQQMKKDTPEKFGYRTNLYLAVHRLFVKFSYPLELRRAVFALFFPNGVQSKTQVTDTDGTGTTTQQDMGGSLITTQMIGGGGVKAVGGGGNYW